MKQEKVYRLVQLERSYQDQKWGSIAENPHTVTEWIAIMREELSEAFFAIEMGNDPIQAMQELVQVVAVGFAALEQYGAKPRVGMPVSTWTQRLLVQLTEEPSDPV